MNKCEWCGKTTDSLNSVTDAYGDIYHICNKCNEKNKSHECIKCGSLTEFSIKGLCTNCYQAVLHKKEVRKEEALSGVGDVDFSNSASSELEFTDADYERWVTMGKAYSPNDIKKSVELRRIWIIVKLNAAGVKDNKVIEDNFANIETLLNRSFSKLINNKCTLIIATTPENKRKIKTGEVIDYEKEVYILKA
jgi:hypothetical protein